MIITRKISITPQNEEIKKEVYKRLDEWQYHSWRLANETYSRLYSLFMDSLRISKATEENIKDVQTRLMEEHLKYVSGTNKACLQNYALLAYKENNYKDNLQSNVAGALISNVLKKFTTDWKDIVRGNKTVANYRRSGMNIYVPRGSAKKDKTTKQPIPGEYQSAGITKVDDEYLLRIPSQRDLKMKFKFFLGRDMSNNKSILDKILTGEYKFCDSYIKKGKKGYSFYLSVNIPDKEVYLDPNRCVGVDLGISIPAVCAVKGEWPREFIGSGKEINKFRFQMLYRKKQAQITCKNAKGGKGRKVKLKALDKFKTYESAWIKNYNHMVSKRIINFAIKNNCGTIKLEFLNGFGADHKENIVLKNWTYFQLQTYIEYKAKREGIAVVYVDPYRTSKTCNVCGSQLEGQRKSQAVFTCLNPECKKYEVEINADYNAALNIAESEKYVSKKEDCIYYKLHSKKVS